jgi:hypothetical protein
MKPEDFSFMGADKYEVQYEVDKALAAFVERVANNEHIPQGLLKLVAKGAREHLSGGKAWKVKQGRSSQTPSFLALYIIAKEQHTNQEIATFLNIELETAKGFKSKANNLKPRAGAMRFGKMSEINVHVCVKKEMIKILLDRMSILDILKEEYKETKKGRG